EDVLDTIWTADDSPGQDTRKGVTAHGLSRRPTSRRTRFLGHVWPTETQMHSSTFTSPDDDCVIIEWTILPSEWPAQIFGARHSSRPCARFWTTEPWSRGATADAADQRPSEAQPAWV